MSPEEKFPDTANTVPMSGAAAINTKRPTAAFLTLAFHESSFQELQCRHFSVLLRSTGEHLQIIEFFSKLQVLQPSIKEN